MTLEELFRKAKDFIGGVGNNFNQNVSAPVQQTYQNIGNFANQNFIQPIQREVQQAPIQISQLEDKIKNFGIGANNFVQNNASRIGQAGINYGIKAPINLANNVGKYGLDVATGNRNILPEVQYSNKFMDAPRMNTAKGVYNLGAGIVNSIGSEGIIRPINDLAQQVANFGYNVPMQKGDLKSGAFKVGFDISKGDQNAQTMLGDAAQTIMPIINAWGGGKVLNAFEGKAIKEVLAGKFGQELQKQALKAVAIQSAKTGAKVGGSYGLAQGLYDNQNQSLGSDLLNSGVSGALGVIMGGGLGYATPYAGKEASGVIGFVKNKLKPETNKVVKAVINGEETTLADLQTKMAKKVGKFAGFNDVQDTNKAAMELWNKAQKKVVETKIPYTPQGVTANLIQKTEGMPIGMSIKAEGKPPLQEGVTSSVSKDTRLPLQSQPKLLPISKVPGETSIGNKTPNPTDLLSKTNQKIVPLNSSYNGNLPPTSDYIKSLTDNQNQARQIEKGGILDRTKGFLADVKRKLVDSTAPIEDTLFAAQKKGKYEVLPKYNIHDQIDRVSRSRELAGQFAKDNGLVQVIKDVPDMNSLNQYLIAKHSGEVATTTGRNAQADSQLIKELAPTYEPYAQRVIQYGQKLLDYATESGLVSKESADALKAKYPNYVPLNRIFNELEQGGVFQGAKTGIANLSKQSVVQKLQGSERAIQNPLESLLTKTADAFSQGERNIAGGQLAGYSKLPGNPFQLEPLRTAENVQRRIEVLTKLKEFFGAQRKDNRTLKFVSKDLRGINNKIRSTSTEMSKLLDQAQTMASEFTASSKINSILDKAQTREYKINDLLSKYHNGEDAQTKSLLENLIGQRKETISELRTELSGVRDINSQAGDGTFSFLNNGIKEIWKTTPEIASAAKLLDKRQLGFVGQIFAAPVRVARVGITGLNVPFIASNIAKDQISGIINSNRALRTSVIGNGGLNFLKSAWSAIGHGGEYENWIRNAGGGTSFDISRSAPDVSVAKIRAGRNVVSKIAYTVTHPSELFRMAENVVARSEELTRLQQFIGTRDALIKEGRTLADANQLAGRQSREATVNFARSGDWGKALNSAFLYINAGIQGSRTLVRNLSERPLATSAKIGLTVFTPLAAVTAWNLSDPQRKSAYDDIRDFEKENNLVIVPPNPTKDPKTGKWNVIKIPFSQEIANLTIPMRKGMEALAGYDAPGFGDFASAILGSVTSLNTQSGNALAGQFIPQAVKPPLEMLLNKSTFTGTDIVPQYLNGQVSKNLPPEMQARPDTSGTAREIGGVLGVSPMKVEYGVKSAFGGLGSQVLNAADQAQADLGIIPKEQIGGQSISEGLQSRFAQATGGQKLSNLFNNKPATPKSNGNVLGNVAQANTGIPFDVNVAGKYADWSADVPSFNPGVKNMPTIRMNAPLTEPDADKLKMAAIQGMNDLTQEQKDYLSKVSIVTGKNYFDKNVPPAQSPKSQIPYFTTSYSEPGSKNFILDHPYIAFLDKSNLTISSIQHELRHSLPITDQNKNQRAGAGEEDFANGLTTSKSIQGAKPDDSRIVENNGTFYTTVGSKGSVKSFDNVGDAQIALNKDSFDKSGKNKQIIDGMVYRKNKAGNIQTPMPENDYNEKLYGTQLISYKKNDNVKSWLETANKQFEALQNQLNDPSLDELDRQPIQNKIDTLVAEYQKYSSYGGFTKPKAGKKMPKALELKPIKALNPVKIIKKQISYSMPKSLNLKQVKSPKVIIKKPTYRQSVSPLMGKRLA